MSRAIGRDLLNVPMGDMISQMALSIAEAQLALDQSGVRQAELMSGKVVLRDDAGNFIDGDGNRVTEPQFHDSLVFFGHHTETDANGTTTRVVDRVSMMELGFTPTFYQFIDTIIEVKIAIKMSEATGTVRRHKGSQYSYSIGSSPYGYYYSATVTPVDATYSSRYSYSAEGSSLLRTKLAPVPPPAVLEERVRALLEQNEAERDDDGNG